MWVALERGGLPISALEPAVTGEPLVLCAVVAAELLGGVAAADSEARRLQRAAFVESLLAALPVVPFNLAAARVHAELAAHLRRSGSPVGAHDLMIGATAIANGLGLLTANLGQFSRLPGLRVVPFPT